MSDLMLLGVLRMPNELFWDDSPMARAQHNSRRLQAADRIEELQAENERLKKQLEATQLQRQDYCDVLNATKKQLEEQVVYGDLAYSLSNRYARERLDQYKKGKAQLAAQFKADAVQGFCKWYSNKSIMVHSEFSVKYAAIEYADQLTNGGVSDARA